MKRYNNNNINLLVSLYRYIPQQHINFKSFPFSVVNVLPLVFVSLFSCVYNFSSLKTFSNTSSLHVLNNDKALWLLNIIKQFSKQHV